MKNLCIIPARGGSKRIPKKNIKIFLGKPIIAYAIETAINSNLFEEVMVSSDDNEIAQLAQSFGASLPFLRSSQNSTDYSSTFEVIEEVISQYKLFGKEFDNVCCIYPCTPLLQIDTICEAYSKLLKYNYASIFPVVEYSTTTQRALVLKDFKVQMMYPEYINYRTQDLDKTYYDAGQFYWLNLSKIFEINKIYTPLSGYLIIDEMFAQDIDNDKDWKMAELKYQLINKK